MESKRFNYFLIIFYLYIMEKFTIILFFIGIIFTIIGYYENKKTSSVPKIEYKFLDKSLEEAQKDKDVGPYEIFKTMFVDPPLLT